ncbi:MAG: hypothetical protein GF313_15335 [Caldithrix sp.]|nr:hypothetical protein [Caldithrix sp.]
MHSNIIHKTLKDKTIVITRAAHQAGALGQALIDRGAHIIYAPVVRMSPPVSWVDCDRAINQLRNYTWIIFSSANAVRYFLQRLKKKNQSITAQKIAAVGRKTAAVVEKNGLQVDLIPRNFTAEGLIEAFAGRDMSEQRVLIPGSNIARQTVADYLRKKAAEVRTIEVYRTETNSAVALDGLKANLKQNKIDVITFFSPSALRAFFDLIDKRLINGSAPLYAAVGPVTAEALQTLGLDARIVPRESTAESLIEAIEVFFKSAKGDES